MTRAVFYRSYMQLRHIPLAGAAAGARKNAKKSCQAFGGGVAVVLAGGMSYEIVKSITRNSSVVSNRS